MTLLERVQSAVAQVEIVDVHTHLFPPGWDRLFLAGVDELLTYHYLAAELLRADPSTSPEAFYAMGKASQANLVWQKLFIERTPLSEAQVGVVRVLTSLGLDPSANDLTEIRQWFAQQKPAEQVDRVLRLAKVDRVVMTNDPFDRVERDFWLSGAPRDERFLAALRIDPLVNSFADVVGHLPEGAECFLEEWVRQMKPKYMALSLPDDFVYPAADTRTKILQQAVIPVAKRHQIPLALMIGVRRQVNPRLKMAGDGMGAADLTCLQRLCGENPEVTFLVTTLALENAHHLCVLARKFANLKVFGAWWFVNTPSIFEAITDMRLEMLGRDFIAQHSDARILEQLIYKWSHARDVVAKSLAKRFEALALAGVEISDQAIAAEAGALLRENAMGVLK
jgi:hypothetical protein